MVSYHDIAGDLQGLADKLEEVNQFTETDFLGVVARLQEISQQARGVASNSAAAAGLLDGEAFTAAIGRLREVLKDVEDLDRASGATVETFREMLARLDKASRVLGGFHRLAFTLKVLALNTRVESARVRHAEIDFSSLGDDVARLAEEISGNSESILAGSATVRKMTGKTLARLGGLSARQQSEFSELILHATAGLDSLTRHHADSSQAAAGIAEHYEGVCASVGEVVRALQFQDITRQQVEHVRDALRELADTLREREGDPEAVGQALEAALLQMEQLRNSRDTLVEAGAGVLEHFRAIAARAEEISAAPAALARSSEREGGSFIDAVRDHLAGVAQGLAACSGSDAESREAVAQVVPFIEQMSGAAGRIEAVGYHLALVALNAQVKTAQIGEAGAALGVLASHIQSLTADTSASTSEVAGHLRFLDTQTQALTKRLGQQSGAGVRAGRRTATSELDLLGTDVTTRIAELTELNRVFAGNLAAITGSADALKNEIRAASDSFTAHSRAAGVFDAVIESLGRIGERLRADLPEGYAPREVPELERHQARYTMHSERRVHEAHYAPEPSVVICDPSPESTPEPEAADEEFGENVELF